MGMVLSNKQYTVLESTLDVHVKTTKIKIFRDISDQFEALNRMVSRWEINHGLAENIWRTDAKNYVKDIEGIDILFFVETSHRIRWMEKTRRMNFQKA